MTTPVQELHKDLQELFAKDDSALGQTHDGEQTPYHEHLAGEVSAAKQQLMATPGADVLDAQLLMDLAYTAFADAEGHQSNGNFRFAMMAQQTGHECLGSGLIN